MATDLPTNYTTLTVELLASYVENNSVRAEDLAGLIASTHAALAALDRPAPVAQEATPEPEAAPAVSARKSFASPDQILSMIDGKPYKSLKRHLSSNGMTPDQYRQRYKLPADYPMVAPGYSEQRRQVAHRLGLGRKPNASQPAAAAELVPAQSTAEPASRPPRKKAGEAKA